MEKQTTNERIYEYICPRCHTDLESRHDLASEQLTCPNCGESCSGSDADPVEYVKAKYHLYVKHYDNLDKGAKQVSAKGYKPKTSALATWSAVLGWTALIPCPGLIAAIPAIVLGHKAIKRIRASEGQLGGQRRARFGMIMGYLLCILTILYMGYVAIFGDDL
jgi:ribosomal protein L37AE/L43A